MWATTSLGSRRRITLYTLVMAALMITGGKLGALLGRKRAFTIGCVIYGAGSATTAIAPSLAVLLIGWSFLEGIGAALILPAIVALVAANFGRTGRPRAYGLVMAAGAVAVAVGPVIGGLFTTYLSWRYVFAGEVLIVLAILALARRMADEPPGARPKIDVLGVVLGRRPRPRGVWCPALGRLGMGVAQAGCAGALRRLRDVVAHPRRPRRALAVFHVGVRA
jgi:MFS family permease